MVDVKTGYGLRHIKSGKVVGYHTKSNSNGECCCEAQHILSEHDDRVWIVDSKIIAGYVRMFSTEWYNAGYDTPSHSFKPEDLEVVEIKIVVSETRPPHIPTPEEYARARYNDPSRKTYDPHHYRYLTDAMKQRRPLAYSLYDLLQETPEVD